MPFVTSSFFVSNSNGLQPSSLLLVVRPGATSSVLALLLVAMPFVTSSFFVSNSNGLQPSSLLLVVRPGATSSVLAPSSDALCY